MAEAAQSDAERLRRLQLVTDAALAHLRLEDLLNALLDRTRLVLEVDTAAILLLDPDADELVARAAVGIEEEVERGVRIPVGEGFAGTVAAERRPVLLTEVDHETVLNPILREKGIKTLLGVPLLIEGAPLGVLHVGALTPREFTRDDIDLLQLVADRAAIAIEHARLFEAEHSARARLEHLQQVTDAALAHLDLDTLLNELLSRIRSILRTDTAVILLLDTEREWLVAKAALGIEEEVEQGVRVRSGRGFAGTVVVTRRPRIIDDLSKAHVENPLLRERGLTSLLGVPLLVHGDAIGVLHVGSVSPRTFTQEDVDLLQLVAERAALAIEKARLHAEVIELDQLKLNFVAIASHELRTPATSVFGVLATLANRRDDLDPEVVDELIRTGYEQGERLRRLLEQLLDLSRLDARSIEVEPRPLVLHRVLEEIAASLPEGAGAQVHLDVAGDLAAVADRLVIERVISNLVVNATRYGRPPIVLSAEQRDRHLRIAVEDHGAGVDPEIEPRLFERFERGPDASGAGLGLAIARAYAQAHGGDLVYAPRRRGARFELILPTPN